MAGSLVLLCHFDGTNGQTTFTDSSPFAHILTPNGGLAVTTTHPKFGAGCADFTIAGTENIVIEVPADFNLGAGQFTLEAWVYFSSAPGSIVGGFLTQWPITSTGLGWFFGMVAGQLAFYYSTTGSDNPSVGAAYTPTLNAWTHYAVDRDASNVLRVYASGVVIASATVSATIYPSPTKAAIGNNVGGSQGIGGYGYIDEARIVTGQAMYAGPFTPPTAPFTPSLAPPVELAGNLGSPSHYGRLKYGLKHYSRISAFAPIFSADLGIVPVVNFAGGLTPTIVLAADLDVHVNLIDFAGGITPQIALGGSLSLDLPLTVLEGGLTPIVVLGASSFVSGPLWADTEPRPSPPWAPSEPCPPSMWTPVGPCDPVAWKKSELCNG